MILPDYTILISVPAKFIILLIIVTFKFFKNEVREIDQYFLEIN